MPFGCGRRLRENRPGRKAGRVWIGAHPFEMQFLVRLKGEKRRLAKIAAEMPEVDLISRHHSVNQQGDLEKIVSLMVCTDNQFGPASFDCLPRALQGIYFGPFDIHLDYCDGLVPEVL